MKGKPPTNRSRLRVISGRGGEGGTTAGTDSNADDTTVVSSEARERAQSRREAEPGDVVSNRYRLDSLIGEGGMGRVFVATDLLYAQQYQDRHAQVAIKFLGREFAEQETARLALQREARKCQELSHPNVVRVLHFDQDGLRPYMIMELMHGMTLGEYIRDKAPTGQPFAQAWPLIEDMGAGLGYIHSQGLVHSDFKPGNVFVGNDGRVKVLDLGIARAQEDGSGQNPETRFDARSLGALSPPYASCEMFEGLAPDPRDDVYALGCVIYELLTGHHPFNGLWAPQARAKELVPPRVPELNQRRWRALKQALCFQREQRLPSTEALLDGLRDDRVRRRRLIWGLGSAAVTAVVVASVLGLMFMQPPDPDRVFLDSLTPASPMMLSEPEARRVDRWLEQGNVYLDYARREFERGNLDLAHHVLKGGADNAYWAFNSVLERVDSDAGKAGILSIVTTYADWAEQTFQAGALPEALWTACQGLAIHPRHVRLNDLAHDISVQLSAARTEATTNCELLAELPSPPADGVIP